MSLKRFDEFNYECSVKATDTNMVIATIYRTDKHSGDKLDRVSYKTFSSLFDSLERRFSKAKKWTNKRVEVLKANESGVEFYSTLESN